MANNNSTRNSTINRNGSSQLDSGTDPVKSAKQAGLRYVNDEQSGIRRRRCGRGFTYSDAQGKTIRDPKMRQRFDSLAIPPAWSDVWICVDESGHIQATGQDDKSRKQYIYHSRWQEVRNQVKFNRLLPFGESLPKLRTHIDKDLRRHGLPRERVVAAVVRLLEESLIRVGNREYARQNESYGLTTMRRKHVDVTTTTISFDFPGKSGKNQQVVIQDARASRLIRQCQELPGQELFQYIDDNGNSQTVESADVNEYLFAATGQAFTAKEFRTWGGTVAAVQAFQELGPPDSEPDIKKKIVTAVKMVAKALGNTVAVCRDYYIHPAIIQAYRENSFFDLMEEAKNQAYGDAYQLEELGVLHLLGDHQKTGAISRKK